jgi:hypothetical protein
VTQALMQAVKFLPGSLSPLFQTLEITDRNVTWVQVVGQVLPGQR